MRLKEEQALKLVARYMALDFSDKKSLLVYRNELVRAIDKYERQRKGICENPLFLKLFTMIEKDTNKHNRQLVFLVIEEIFKYNQVSSMINFLYKQLTNVFMEYYDLELSHLSGPYALSFQQYAVEWGYNSDFNVAQIDNLLKKDNIIVKKENFLQKIKRFCHKK